ncbi:MAG TPA: acyloxyacyl hydrolase [Myxococcales bacterium]
MWPLLAALLLLAPFRASGEDLLSFAVSTGQLGLRKEIPHALGIDVQVRSPWRWKLIRPLAGVLTSSSGGAYVYSGIVVDIPLPGGLRLSPGFAPGVVLAKGDRELGSPIEFRSSLEISLAPSERLRLGLGLTHISNARLSQHNPGMELLTFSLAIPVGK